jgi:hypothetical protein
MPKLKEQVIEVKYSRAGRNFSIEAINRTDGDEPKYRLYINHVDRDGGVYYKASFSSVTEAREQIIDFLTNK